MRYTRHIIILAALAILLATGCERKVTNEIITVVPAPGANYIGSESCGACHSDIFASFTKTGHPYKLNEADSVQMPGYFPDFVMPLEIPSDLSWGQIDKIIGGFWWKARYIEPENGAVYIGPDRQYNLIEGHEGFVAYDGSSPGFKDYDCGPCHTTGYIAEGNQEGKDSLIGTWAFNGIQCEECHGPGEVHAADPHNSPMTIDYSSEQCGKCHIRGRVDEIPAKGGFIRHHEQWNEVFTTKHSALQCVDCHDPHVGLHPNNPERADAIKATCEGCHFDETRSFEASSINHVGSSSGPDCIDCHMPRAAKSAVAVGAYEADVRSHLMRINTNADAEMFTPDGSLANGYLTLEYTCLQCHASETKEWAAAYAGAVHAGMSVAPSYVGSEACAACHQSTYDSFIKTGHPFKLNEAEDVQTPGYFPDFVTPLEIPSDLTWNDIDKVIGGFWWKARYIEPDDGFVYIGPDRQYNLIEGFEGFVAYDGSTPGFKDYNCGPCHMTDYKDVGNQEGKVGLIGTWALNGIQCEECHGPGEAHINDAFNAKMVIDRSSEQCGKCHVRGDVNKIPVKNGFIRHHEQWNEMFTTKHASMDCIDCHDPHVGLHPDNPDRAMGIKIKCENCHFNEAVTYNNTPIDGHISESVGCIDCHMPRAAKSAVAVGTYEGDVRSHLWRISTDSTAEMFTPDGGFANGYLTLEFTCLQCHTDPAETKGWAAENAMDAHGPMPAPLIDDQITIKY